MNISDKIKYIGVDDTTIDLFESQYAVPDGVSYNSYVILDDKTSHYGYCRQAWNERLGKQSS